MCQGDSNRGATQAQADRMNPLKFMYNSIKTDIIAVKTMFNRAGKGEPQFDPEKKRQMWEAIKSIRPIDYLRDSWMWLLLILFVAAVAWILAAQYYQIQCNNFIIENYVIPELSKISSQIAPSWNLTLI